MSKRISKFVALGFATLMATAGIAAAQDPPEGTGEPVVEPAAEETPLGGPLTKETYPLAVIDRPLQVIKGMIEIGGNTVIVNMSKSAVGKPVAIAPSVYYGINDKMSVGVFHSLGICLTGTDNGCPKVYNDLGADFRYYVIDAGKFLLSAHAGVQLYFLDEVALAGLIGAYMQYSFTPKFAILLDPTISIKLKDVGNAISIPVWLGYQATPALWVFLSTAFGGPFDGFGDAFTGSLGVGATYAINNLMDVGGEFQFTNLYGKHFPGQGAADGRALILRFAIRL
jgi:hypothetical protein